MSKPFTSEEMKKAVERLKNNKSSDADNVKAELLKYGNDEIFEEIAIILNGVATTGEHPDELTHGILIPLQKPGKARGPTENLRPIILFSLLRKILAICILERSQERINNVIPVTQAAYKQGRSTTEHTFAIKTLVEWAITSKNEKVLLLSDMSKAFDTINLKTLVEVLSEVLNEDKLHRITILLNVKLAVKNESTLGKYFPTDT